LETLILINKYIDNIFYIFILIEVVSLPKDRVKTGIKTISGLLRFNHESGYLTVFAGKINNCT